MIGPINAAIGSLTRPRVQMPAEVAGEHQRFSCSKRWSSCLVAPNVVSDYLFVTPDSRYEISARPEALANEIPTVLPVTPCQGYRVLSLDETNLLQWITGAHPTEPWRSIPAAPSARRRDRPLWRWC